MNEEKDKCSTSSSFDGMISTNPVVISRTESFPTEKSDSDDESDHFSASQCLSRIDFCKSIRNTQNGDEIFHSINSNLEKLMLCLLSLHL